MFKTCLLALTLVLFATESGALDCTAYAYRPDSMQRTAPDIGSFLYEISPVGVPPSLVFGTFHSADAAVLTRWGKLAPLLASRPPRLFISERDLTASIGLERQQLSSDRTLPALLNRESGLYKAARDLLRLPSAQIDRLQPWFVGALLAQAPARPQRRNERIIDHYLWDIARKLEIPTHTLEDFSVIADYYERRFSLAEHIRLLAEAVCNQGVLRAAIERQTQAFANNDPVLFYRLLHEYNGSNPALGNKLIEVFVRERNEAFWAKLWPQLQEGNVFIAVGGLHLFGEGGLLERLRTQSTIILRPIDPASLRFAFDVSERSQTLLWVQGWLKDAGFEGISQEGLATVRLEHLSLGELRERLCPGRYCTIESTYIAAEQAILFCDEAFASLLIDESALSARLYADSLLVRELVRHGLNRRVAQRIAAQQGTFERGQGQCIQNAILHQASLAQQAYLREHQSGLSAHLFPLDPRCPALEL